jgi:hypothetical protein
MKGPLWGAPRLLYAVATKGPNVAFCRPSFVGGGGVFYILHTNNLSEKYFPTKNNCTRKINRSSVAGYMKGVDWVQKQNQWGGVYSVFWFLLGTGALLVVNLETVRCWTRPASLPQA